jgi:DNA-binding transcriptional LysR family regulator
LNLRQLHVFASVVKHMSVSLAAEELFITQPAVSQQIRGLEERLGVKLFERTPNGLLLTEGGEAILPHVQAILASRARIDNVVAEQRGATRGHLAVGSNTTGGMYVVSPMLRAFRDAHPEAEIVLQVLSTDRICERILQNLLDVAVVTGPVEVASVVVADLCEDELYLIVSPSHPFAARATVSRQEVAAEAFVVPEPGSRTRRLIQRAIESHGLKLQISMQLPGTEEVKKAVEANLGVAMVSKHAVTRELALGALHRVTIHDLEIHRPIQSLHRRGRRLSPIARLFLGFAAKYAREDPVLGAPSGRADA